MEKWGLSRFVDLISLPLWLMNESDDVGVALQSKRICTLSAIALTVVKAIADQLNDRLLWSVFY